MGSARRTGCLLLVLFAWASLSGGCAARQECVEQAPSSTPQPSSHKTSQATDPELPTPHAGSSGDTAAHGESEPTSTDPKYLIRYRVRQDGPLYFVIENDFIDHGGVPGFLSYTTIVKDRRTIIQTVEPPAAPKKRVAKTGPARLLWVCDRYEVTEQGMKDKVKFDSLRDLYPRAALRALGAVPGSRVSFDFTPTGHAKNLRIQPGRILGKMTRKKLSSTARRCEVNQANLTKLFDDLGPLFIPKLPKAVGESWTRRRKEAAKSYGGAIRDYTFTLKDVRDEAGHRIAVIDVRGDVRLPPAQASATTKANQTSPRSTAKAKRQFKIDKKLCSGSIEFDLTDGRLERLTLRRALDLSAEMESKTNRKMSIETGAYHMLRVAVSKTPPAKPMIVGGPKPPPDEPEPAPRPGVRPVPPRNRGRRPLPTTRPHRGDAEPPRVGPTSQKAAKPAGTRRRPRPGRAPHLPRPSTSPHRAPRTSAVLPPRSPSQPTSQPGKTPS